MSSAIDTSASPRLTKLFGLAAITVAFVFDQATKLMALATLERGNAQSVLPFFDLRLSFNQGISFSMFAETFAGRPTLLAGITLVIVALFAILLIRSTVRWEAIAFGLIIGGALGNALDRVRLGAVVDFLDFHVRDYHWPAFNFADAAIVVGVMVLLVTSFGNFADNQSKENPS
ncbi:signal peptidase II [Hyphomicrobium sp. DMF-1]|uniref:signal peptidase II n=1 Tax=Hyphomicrobium sp. DMF-1 TaxID=3019544 RepID=UPI0022EBEC75|nr:signal peptidase II [Hyphomicrobium sp. DMF-1]WBT38024.1 signal peptidase II [Hyphomicrobium sp. DMF-1]